MERGILLLSSPEVLRPTGSRCRNGRLHRRRGVFWFRRSTARTERNQTRIRGDVRRVRQTWCVLLQNASIRTQSCFTEFFQRVGGFCGCDRSLTASFMRNSLDICGDHVSCAIVFDLCAELLGSKHSCGIGGKSVCRQRTNKARPGAYANVAGKCD